MIRLIQRRLIIPRGDTGSFSIPVLSKGGTDNIAVFTIFDETTRTKMFQKIISGEGDVLTIAFTHSDTVNLKPGKYVWDIKYYKNPEYIDDELVNGEEIDSYYAGFSLPVCEIRETADNYLVSPEAPTATLSPEQLEIVTGAIHSLNEAIRKTQENVEYYPEIRDEVWYVWDAELGDYASTDVRANGIVGNGIASAVLNNDYTLTLNFTDGTSFTSPSIRGQKGNGIDDIVLNNDFTLTITYTDGDSYVTPSIRGPVGATPQFSIGNVQDGAVAAASITGTAENPVLNLTLPNAHVPTRVSQLENDSNYAVDANYVHTDNNYTTAEKNKLSGIAAGAEVNVNADWNASSGDAQILNKPTKVSDFTNDAGYLTSFTETDPTVPAWAKAAQKPTYTASEVGAPTVAEMNTAIGTAIGQINSFDMAVVQALPTQDISTHIIYLVPKTGETNDVYDEYVYINNNWEMVGNTQIDLSNYATKDELPDVPVQDVQINETSIISNGIANIQKASSNNLGVVGIEPQSGVVITSSGKLEINPASTADIKKGENTNKPIVVFKQDAAAFYGLATAAGDTTQSTSSNVVGAYTDEAKAAIQQMLDVPSTSDIPEVPVTDVQVNGVSVVSGGIVDIPVASANNLGVVKISVTGGITIDSNTNYLRTARANASLIKAGIDAYRPIVPEYQDQSVFYGLAKAAGDTTQAQSDNAAGIYTSEAKTAIQTMLDVPAKDDIPNVPVTDVQVNGVSVLSDGVANVPISGSYGLNAANGEPKIKCAGLARTKAGTNAYEPIVASHQHESTFYGLAKVAGHDEASSTESVGTYTPEAKGAIQQMLGVSDLIATAENSLVASKAYAIGDIFTANGKLYKATAAIAADAAIIPVVEGEEVSGANCVETSVGEGFVKFTDYATATTPGIGTVNGYGIGIRNDNHSFTIVAANDNSIKNGNSWYSPIATINQHKATFYGLAKAAGADEKNSILPVGQYTDTAKSAIRSMLGATSSNVIAIQDTQPTDTDTKIWLPETAETPIQVPTVAEMNAALAGKVDDVQINGTSILSNGMANVPVADANNFGTVKVNLNNGIYLANGILTLTQATESQIKAGTNSNYAVRISKQHISTFYGLAAAAGDATQSQSDNAVGTYTDEAKAAIKSMIGVNVEDVQVEGTSIVNNGIASLSKANATTYGLVKTQTGNTGIYAANDGTLYLATATDAQIKSGSGTYPRAITPGLQNKAVFYGLAQASGDTTMASSSNAVGQYTDNAKASIKSMLGIVDGSTGTVDVTGAAPTITAVENTRYVCGEVTSLTITPAASGICIIRFTSGSTPTLLTLPSTVKFPEWFDATTLETSTIYEICITDGVYGAVMSWAL